MAKTDVVKHDLTVPAQAGLTNWDEDINPIPLPRGRAHELSADRLKLVVPPVTTLVSDEERVTAPYRSVGKMGMITVADKKMVGSGWVVARRAFMTAGHCVFDPSIGGWIAQAVFLPRYNAVVESRFIGMTAYALKGWVEDHDYAYDMAACVVTENFADTEPPLAFDTGIIPAFNDTAIGYPKRPIPGHDFNGMRMWKCVGKMIEIKNGEQSGTNNLSDGASGGPWCDTDGNYVVTGLNSNRENDPNILFSPLFDNGFQKLYDAVKNL